MNATLLWRLVWKDYRVLRGYWLALAVFGAVVQLLAWQLSADPDAAGWQVSMAVVVPGLFAVGGGATLFALEREERTDDFLRSLPVGPWTLFAAKLTLGVVATAALAGLLAALASLQPPWISKWDIDRYGVAWAAVMVAHAFGWALLFSLVLSRPLLATFLAAVAWLLAFPLMGLVGSAYLYFSGQAGSGLDAMMASYPIVTVVLLAVDGCLAGRWLHGAAPSHRAAVRWPAIPLRPIVERMLWQQARQARWLLFGLMLLALVTGMFSAAIWSHSGQVVEPQQAQYAEQSWTLVVSAIVLVCSLLGSCVFLADQVNRQVRFLAELGISPRTVWWSRQLFWMAASVVIASLTLLPALILATNRPEAGAQIRSQFAVGVLVAALTYSAGQLASIVFSSGLLAAFFGLVMSVVVVIWAKLMIFLGVDWRWSAAPIALVLLAASRVRTPGWLVDRRDWRAWLPVAGTVVVGLSLLVLSVAWYRIAEIPWAEPRVTTADFIPPVTDEERGTAQLYRQAAGMLTGKGEPTWSQLVLSDGNAHVRDMTPLTASEKAWLKANEGSLRLTLDASRRPNCIFDDPERPPQQLPLYPSARLATLLLLSGRELEDENQLDQALDRYLAIARLARHLRQRGGIISQQLADGAEAVVAARLPLWAAQAGQSADGIRQALAEYSKIVDSMPSIAEVPSRDGRAWYKDVLTELEARRSSRLQIGDQSAFKLLALRLPWERRRIGRLLDYAASADFEMLQSLEGRLAKGGSAGQFRFGSARANGLYRSTLGLSEDFLSGARLEESLIKVTTYRRATRLTLHLMAWRLEKGLLPDRLADLGDRSDLHDPYSDRPFRYEPGGLRINSLKSPLTGALPPGRPLIWSVGPSLAGGRSEFLSTDYVWEHGWSFPIPDQAESPAQ